MDVSIIICTRNRCESLRATLTSIAVCGRQLELEVELLVVDNGSTDGTAGIVDKLAETSDRISVRRIAQPSPGLSLARSRGVSESRGAAILWTDDDVIVPNGWINAMACPILRHEADLVIGGWTHPSHKGVVGKWMADAGFTFPTADSSQLVHQAAPLPFGLNMACNRYIAEGIGFDPKTGAGALGYGDDTLFGLRARAAGNRILVQESVRVEHYPDPARFTPDGVRRAAVSGGRSAAYLDYHWYGVRRSRLRTMARLIRRKWFERELEDSSAVAQRRKLERVYDLAYMSEYLRQSVVPRKYERERERGERYTIATPRSAESPYEQPTSTNAGTSSDRS